MLTYDWMKSGGRSLDMGTRLAGPITKCSALRWLEYTLGGIIVLVLLLAAIGATYEAIAESREVREAAAD